MSELKHSKTFVFEKIVLAVQFVEEIDKFHYQRAWHDKQVRVTVEKDKTDHVNTIAAKYEGEGIVGDKGTWKDVWK